jgi:hypothetical protein
MAIKRPGRLGTRLEQIKPAPTGAVADYVQQNAPAEFDAYALVSRLADENAPLPSDLQPDEMRAAAAEAGDIAETFAKRADDLRNSLRLELQNSQFASDRERYRDDAARLSALEQTRDRYAAIQQEFVRAEQDRAARRLPRRLIRGEERVRVQGLAAIRSIHAEFSTVDRSHRPAIFAAMLALLRGQIRLSGGRDEGPLSRRISHGESGLAVTAWPATWRPAPYE